MTFQPDVGFGYVRLYADEHGQSHFEDVVVAGNSNGPVTTAAPIPLQSMVMLVVSSPAPEPTWHNSPRRQFVVHLENRVEMESSDGECRVFIPGEVLLVEDLTGRGHLTRFPDEGTCRTLFLPLAD